MSTPLTPAPGATPASRSGSRSIAADLLVVGAVFAVLAVLAGVLWPQLADPVQVVLSRDGVISTGETALSQRFDEDGWYSVLAVVLGAAAGLGLTWALVVWRHRDPLLVLVAVVAGAAAAAWVAARVGTAAGPPDPRTVLASAEVGATAPDSVRLATDAAYLLWPIAAAAGALVVLLFPHHGDESDAPPGLGAEQDPSDRVTS